MYFPSRQIASLPGPGKSDRPLHACQLRRAAGNYQGKIFHIFSSNYERKPSGILVICTLWVVIIPRCEIYCMSAIQNGDIHRVNLIVWACLPRKPNISGRMMHYGFSECTHTTHARTHHACIWPKHEVKRFAYYLVCDFLVWKVMFSLHCLICFYTLCFNLQYFPFG